MKHRIHTYSAGGYETTYASTNQNRHLGQIKPVFLQKCKIS
jgi:hypothetical protein